MKKLYIVLALAVWLGLAGCTTSYTLTVRTVPENANILWEHGGRIAQTPHTLTFEHDPRHVDNGCYRVNPISAEWLSGAQSEASSDVLLCQPDNELEIVRPSSVPGEHFDFRFALLLQELRALDEQKDAAEVQQTKDKLEDLIMEVIHFKTQAARDQ